MASGRRRRQAAAVSTAGGRPGPARQGVRSFLRLGQRSFQRLGPSRRRRRRSTTSCPQEMGRQVASEIEVA
eukprot:11175025-Lingulodinium_polyedra.AAC.1